MKNELINLIKVNRISTVEVSDALGKKGVLENIFPLNNGLFSVGEVQYVSTWNKSNFQLHKQIQNVNKNCILFIDAINCNEFAVLGDLVAKSMILYNEVNAIVVDGLVRDAHRLRKENYPIWSKGTTPLGCFNKEEKITKEIIKHIEKRKKIFDKSIIVADDSGCTLIKKNEFKLLFDKLKFIELQEDIWYFCIDVLKMTTFETICEKEYLKNPNLLPNNLRNKLHNYLNK